jgi:UDP-glucose 4-epimerase
MRTTLVTGAAGFIGSALCARLVGAGYRVIGYDNLSRGHREYLPSDVHLVEGDIRDGRRLSEAIAEWTPDSVIHLAAMHFIPDCIAHPETTMDVNVEGTRRVLECCERPPVRHVVFASTAAVYAPSDHACVEEVTPLGPLEVYGESKVEGEELVHAFHEKTGKAATILRLFNAIGRNETNPHVVPHIFESLQRSDIIELGNTAPRRDYIDTRDIAEAVISVLARDRGFRIFNVGSGNAYSVDELVLSLQRILGRPITVVQDPSRVRPTERMMLLAAIDVIRQQTRWAPRLALDDTLADLVAAYALQRQTTDEPR